MTLCMYALVTRERPADEVDFDWDEHMEFHYWCDRHDLHGWMERLYDRKGGMLRVFWKGRLALTETDLDRLERHTNARELVRKVRHVFDPRLNIDFGDDLYFITKARQALRMGLTVIYSASW